MILHMQQGAAGGRHGRHLESVTSCQKSDTVNRCVFTWWRIVPNFTLIRFETTVPQQHKKKDNNKMSSDIRSVPDPKETITTKIRKKQSNCSDILWCKDFVVKIAYVLRLEWKDPVSSLWKVGWHDFHVVAILHAVENRKPAVALLSQTLTIFSKFTSPSKYVLLPSCVNVISATQTNTPLHTIVTYVITVPIRYRQTDGRTDRRHAIS